MIGSKLVRAALTSLIACPVAAAELSGHADIIDGDTIRVAGESVRIEGIDAPETDQECWTLDGAAYPCGAEATSFLAKLIGGAPVSCAILGRDRYDRSLGICEARGVEINAEMVRSGWALAFRKYSDAYVHEEAAAEQAGAGLWKGTFIYPWDWRSGAVAETVIEGQECTIKGNISSSGERIYHMPFQSHYNRTKIDESKGERWFCAEDEALQAGWRRALR